MTTTARPAPALPAALPPPGRGPLTPVLLGSLLTGLAGALASTLLVFPGAPEHTITGSILLAFAAGWAMLAALSSRLTSQPQRWALVPAAVLGVTGLALVSCRSCAVGPGVWVVGPADGGKVKITGGRLVKLEGAYVSTVHIDSTSQRTQVGGLTLGTGGLRDDSTSTVYLDGPEMVGALSHPSGAAAVAAGNRVLNGDLSRWPTGFGVAGSAPTVVWTGDGQSDTTRFLNTHALRVSSSDTQGRLVLVPVQDTARMTGRVVTIWADVQWNSGADFRVGAYDGNQFLFGSVLPAGSSGFHRVAMTFVPTTSTWWVVLGGYNAVYDGYVAEVGAALGQVAPAGAESPAPSLQTGFLMGGRQVTYGSGTTTPGTGVGEDGDVIVNLAPTVIGSGSTAYFIDRWRKVGGAWKPITHPA